MTEESPEFIKLDITEQERFLDINENDFSKVVDRMEEKAMRTGINEIDKLKQLRQKRRVADSAYFPAMDSFYDDGTLVIIDSSKLMGARVIVKFIRRWKERK